MSSSICLFPTYDCGSHHPPLINGGWHSFCPYIMYLLLTSYPPSQEALFLSFLSLSSHLCLTQRSTFVLSASAGWSPLLQSDNKMQGNSLVIMFILHKQQEAQPPFSFLRKTDHVSLSQFPDCQTEQPNPNVVSLYKTLKLRNAWDPCCWKYVNVMPLLQIVVKDNSDIDILKVSVRLSSLYGGGGLYQTRSSR